MQSQLLQKLINVNIVQYGNFTLKSGEKSNVYCDFRKLIGHPDILKEVCLELGTMFESNENIVVAGVPMGAIPYSSCISSLYNLPSIMIREAKKDHGTGKIIEGDYNNLDSVVLIEDVITTGSSIINTLEILKKENIPVKEIIVILDRERGGCQRIAKLYGLAVKSLFKLSQLTNMNKQVNLKVNYIKNLIETKGTNLVLAADITDYRKVITTVDQLGPYLLGVKLHVDIYDIENVPELIHHIKLLKAKHNLLIIEDRKFSDIGAIVSKQVNIIKGWADIVTAHGLVGEEMMKALDDSGIAILPIHQLSTADNLIDARYSWLVKKMAYKFNNIIGFISQEQVIPNLLTFSPGVNISNIKDTQGQRYNTPETMINKGTDIFIVGRGIYESPDPIQTCIEYRDRCQNSMRRSKL